MENSPDKTKTARKGMPLRFMNVLLILLAVSVSAVLFFDVFSMAKSYREYRETSERYVAIEKNATAIKAGSDYLTEQVRLFAVTGSRQYMDNYFTEAKVTKSREKALENIRPYIDENDEDMTALYEDLCKTLNASNRLMEQEYRSMKIRAISAGLDDLPPEVTRADVGAIEQSMSPSMQKEHAIEIVFSDLYNSYKSQINDSIQKSLDELEGMSKEIQLERETEMNSNLWLQTVLIVVTVLILLLIVVMTSVLIIHPMRQALKYIENDEKVPVKGASEMRVLARTYNEMYALNAQKKMELSFAANHDGLTGLYNRTAYLRALAEADWQKVAVIALDVDSFKQINDTYGHATGDSVLKSVADALTTVFRADDFVCRIGGDEFTVVMKNADNRLRKLIKAKTENTLEIVAHPTDEKTPPVSLSFGVAFGNWQEEADKVANRADVALYSIKKNGKSGCAFFDDLEETDGLTEEYDRRT